MLLWTWGLSMQMVLGAAESAWIQTHTMPEDAVVLSENVFADLAAKRFVVHNTKLRLIEGSGGGYCC